MVDTVSAKICINLKDILTIIGAAHNIRRGGQDGSVRSLDVTRGRANRSDAHTVR